MKSAITNRDLSANEANYETSIPKGTQLYRCVKPDYGCCTDDEESMTFKTDGDYPFMGIPKNALTWDKE